MLGLTRRLLEELNSNNIRYCQWKSNISLESFLSGNGDLDILVDKRQKDKFETILAELHFKKIIVRNGIIFPSILHFYGLDEESGIILHLHVYYEIITGESLVKNYHLPVEDMLLNNTENQGIVRTPTKSAELVLFVIRMILKHGILAETILIHRKYENVTKELKWLCEKNTQPEALKLVENWLPSIRQEFFINCINALKSKSKYLQRIILSHRMQIYLKNYSRYPLWKASVIANYIFLSQLYRRLILKRRNKVLSYKGFIIAFVGPDASGKSTLSGNIKDWLGENFSVYLFHIGKPSPSLLTIIPNIVLKTTKKLVPERKKIDTGSVKLKNKKNSLVLFIYALRNLLLAFDRFHLLKKARQLAQTGNIVICDRYPTSQIGAMDSPRLDPADFKNAPSVIKKLIDMENEIYMKMPLPDFVISLKIPVELAIDRNLSRKNKEIESYLHTRHNQWKDHPYLSKNVQEIYTNNAFQETLLEVKKVIWKNLPS